METSTRTRLAAVTFAALTSYGPPGVAADARGPAATPATALDPAIERIVRHLVAARKLDAAAAPLAREQLRFQFLAMSPEARASVLVVAGHATADDHAPDVLRALNEAVADAARREAVAVRDARIAAIGGSKQAAGAALKKLGADGDLVFVATAGPCRVADTRLGHNADRPGMLGGFAARQIWAFSWYTDYDYASEQGGTGIAGTGNCAGTVFSSGYPASVVATVAIVNTASTGYLRAWNGGTTLTVGGILGWNAGDVLSNTTVIPLNRNIDAYPDSGAIKRDFAVYNNSGSPVDVVVDVVGYFVRNQATALACTRVSDSRVHGLAPGASIELLPPACPPDWTPIVALPRNHEYGVDVGMVSETTCRFANYTTAIQDVSCDMQCCRVPGR